MSEFKFACPVCGQHITADSRAAGSQLACPTCFRKIVVPQAPGSTERKFILSAAEVDKPRPLPPDTLSPSGPAAPPRRWHPLLLSGIGLLVLAGSAAAVFLYLRGRPEPGPVSPTNGVSADAFLPPATNKLPWTLDLSAVSIPDVLASGRIRNRDFVYQRATLQGGNLTLRHGRSGATDLGLSIYFFTGQPHELSGRSLRVTTNNTRSPRVVLRWKNGDRPATQTIRNGYALKVDFDSIVSNRMTGRIYICLPDAAQSCVAGTFDAEIRRPSPPRPPPQTVPATNR